jgi:transcriptional regulator with XRE-family HTH domain
MGCSSPDLDICDRPSALRNLRVRQGLTLAEVADRVGLSVSHLSRLERGRRRLKADELSQILQGLGASPDEQLRVLHGQSLAAPDRFAA